jgi:hypothetical protein
MASTSGDVTAAIRMFLVIWLSSVLGLIASFLLGRAMRGIQVGSSTGAEKRSILWKRWLVTMALFAHPYTGSLHAFRVGGQDKALSAWPSILVANFIWSIFWGVTTYKYGLWLYEGNTLLTLIWAYVLIWLSMDSFRHFQGQKSN